MLCKKLLEHGKFREYKFWGISELAAQIFSMQVWLNLRMWNPQLYEGPNVKVFSYSIVSLSLHFEIGH